MDRWVAVAVTVAAGGAIAFQPVTNSVLARETGALGASLVGFLIGTIVMATAVALTGDLGRLSGITDVSWYYVLVGGFTGVIIVTVSLITVRELGAGGVVAGGRRTRVAAR